MPTLQLDDFDLLLPTQLQDPIPVVIQASNVPVGSSVGIAFGGPRARTFGRAFSDWPTICPKASRISPTRPSRTTFRGLFETIVAKAMEKDKARRYASAAELADDIRRRLADDLIIARTPSALYHLQKFSRRHKAVVIGTGAVMAALICGVIVSAWQGRVAIRQRDGADAEAASAKLRFNDLRQLANSLLFEINDAIKDLPGATPARMLPVKESLTYLDKLAQKSSNELSLQNELAEAYRRIGDVQPPIS